MSKHKATLPRIILSSVGIILITVVLAWGAIKGIKLLKENSQNANNSRTEISETTQTAENSVPEERSVEESVPESTVESVEESVEESFEESSEEESVPEPYVPVVYDYEPHAVEETEPSRLISWTRIIVDGSDVSSYEAEKEVNMVDWQSYAQEDGIFTFRGNNFRNSAVVGNVTMTEKKFDVDNSWMRWSDYLDTKDGSRWTGNGWTGQPLMRRWTPEEKAGFVTMYDWAKEKDELVEVIYASLDGNVYFLDLDTGENTRPYLQIGYVFKGAGTLDPRGYPILYVGSGYWSGPQNTSKVFVISLIDGSIMYEIPLNDPYAPRTVPFADGSALICAETDQLIYPTENGIIYIVNLNTEYDVEAGTVSINPETPIRWTYNIKRNWMWLGMEDSPIIYHHYLIASDNGGTLFCLDLNTLQLVWAQDVLDDTNCTPVLEIEEDGKAYIYTSTSFHGGWRAPMDGTAPVPVWKIDAETGEIIWRTDYICSTIEDLSGGTLGTLALGTGELQDYLYITIARIDDDWEGDLIALNKQTGEQMWHYHCEYSWSSPVCIYDQDGHGYVLFCNFGGYLVMLDGITGEVVDIMNLDFNIEASPAVYENRLVVGTRGQKIWGVTFK
ncbi:MAG: PQQ-binding-like beta-propeller repeat protein [Firmicutes bacterium]|nr:PQQ-binding-like beta-propeller repeat protein [Bacillota bacterium]